MLLNRELKDTICLNCRRKMCASPSTEDWICCPNCGHEFLLFENQIPIFYKDWKPHLAASYLQYTALETQNEELIRQISDAKARQPNRAELLNKAIKAYQGDNRYYQRLHEAIERYIPKAEIDEMKESGNLPRQYTLDEGIAFFHRDWCWSQESEKEIATIMGTIFQQVDAFAEDTDAA